MATADAAGRSFGAKLGTDSEVCILGTPPGDPLSLIAIVFLNDPSRLFRRLGNAPGGIFGTTSGDPPSGVATPFLADPSALTRFFGEAVGGPSAANLSSFSSTELLLMSDCSITLSNRSISALREAIVASRTCTASC
eukprot:CAMPEP_0205889902 /NCGR_PEP_ID=MMETSP1083-20121108/21226_1 /ASSEMBLY_ACC=CAM_ASM_000430 /TAXON_ID=97485 /ORGANISM="Prymnesium parvum, Strain Texoma1" /LENGTH=136 /DNA_ID=CAMNT_0053254055 /DNA_START=207 /DNA_END=614 /DNA_ORIENTATION=+